MVFLDTGAVATFSQPCLMSKPGDFAGLLLTVGPLHSGGCKERGFSPPQIPRLRWKEPVWRHKLHCGSSGTLYTASFPCPGH